jgi:hypothetical protein
MMRWLRKPHPWLLFLVVFLSGLNTGMAIGHGDTTSASVVGTLAIITLWAWSQSAPDADALGGPAREEVEG